MEERIAAILNELKDRISRKHSLIEMRLFGSSARGDRRAESDIDVFVHLCWVDRSIEEELFDIAYELELEHDCVIDMIVVGDKELAGSPGKSFIFRSVLEESIAV